MTTDFVMSHAVLYSYLVNKSKSRCIPSQFCVYNEHGGHENDAKPLVRMTSGSTCVFFTSDTDAACLHLG